MPKGHSMMDIGEGSKKQRQSLKNDLKADVTGIVEKYAPGTIMPEVPVAQGKGDVYTPEDMARGLGQSGGDTKTLPSMKYTPQMEKLMRMGIRQQLQNTYPSRNITDEDIENAFSLRKEIMIRDFDQWAMTAFDLKQPGVAKMLEEYYPELLERITNMIEQDIEISRFDKYQRVFFPMNYDDLVMKWARERGWIKTMEEIERENLLGAAGRYGKDGKLRAGYTPDLSPMFNAQTANISSGLNRPYGRNDVDFDRGNPFTAMKMDTFGTRGPATTTAAPYQDQNLLPTYVNPAVNVSDDFGFRASQVPTTGRGTVAGMGELGQTSIQKLFQTMVRGVTAQQAEMQRVSQTALATHYNLSAAQAQAAADRAEAAAR